MVADRTLRHQVSAFQTESDQLRATLVNSNVQLQNDLESLRQDLATFRRESDASLAKAQEAATRHSDLLAQSRKA